MGKNPVDTGHQLLKVVIGIPNEGCTRPESYDNHLISSFRLGALEQRLKMENAPIQYEFNWFTVGRILTPLAREKLVDTAMKNGADFIIMFDDDMVLPMNMFEKMLEDMVKHPDIDILGALAFMRRPPHSPVIYNVTSGWDSVRHKDYYINEVVKNYPKNAILECDAVGFGAVCIRMSMVAKMTPPWFMSTTATGEDILFCVNAKKIGARVFMDTGIKLGHLSDPTIIDEEMYFDYSKKHKLVVPPVKAYNKYLTKKR